MEGGEQRVRGSFPEGKGGSFTSSFIVIQSQFIGSLPVGWNINSYFLLKEGQGGRACLCFLTVDEVHAGLDLLLGQQLLVHIPLLRRHRRALGEERTDDGRDDRREGQTRMQLGGRLRRALFVRQGFLACCWGSALRLASYINGQCADWCRGIVPVMFS